MAGQQKVRHVAAHVYLGRYAREIDEGVRTPSHPSKGLVRIQPGVPAGPQSNRARLTIAGIERLARGYAVCLLQNLLIAQDARTDFGDSPERHVGQA